MEPVFFLEQIERLRVQAERETDPILRKEHRKTIRHLHRQFRKATKHRKPWFGFLRITVTFFAIFLLAFWAVAKIVNTYGQQAIGAGRLTLIAFVVISITMLLMLRFVSPETYANVIGGVLADLRSLWKNESSSPDLPKEALPESRPVPELPNTTDRGAQFEPAPKVVFDINASENPKPPHLK